MKLSYAPVPPIEMLPSEPVSSSDFIAARRTKVFLPDSQTTYSFDTNDRLTFTLNSNSEMVDGRNSHLEFDITCTCDGGNLDTYQKARTIFGSGGGHALFRRMQISLSNGTVIEDIPGYNKLYSIIRHNTMSENHLRYVEHQSGDGMTDDFYEADHYDAQSWRDVTYTQSEALYDHTGGAAEQLLTLATTANTAHARSELAVGDILRIETAVLNYTARVLTVENNLTVTVEGLPAADISANAILSLKVARTGQVATARYRAGSTSGIKLKLKIFSDFFSNKKYIPLFLLKNLQLTYELERAAIALKCLTAPGTSPSMTYTISNPRLICSMVTPAQSELEGMLAAYNSQDGIYIPFLSYQHHLKSVSSGTSGSLTIPANCRSARSFIFAQYPSCAEAVDTDSYVNDTIGTTVKNLLTEFRVKIGSENYPYARPVDCDDVYNGEAMVHLQQALGQFGNHQFCTSIVPSDYWCVSTVVGVSSESSKFVGGVLLARYDSSVGMGVDLINNDVILEYTRSGAGLSTAYFRSWVIHDRSVIISRNGTVVFS